MSNEIPTIKLHTYLFYYMNTEDVPVLERSNETSLDFESYIESRKLNSYDCRLVKTQSIPLLNVEVKTLINMNIDWKFIV